MGILQKTANFLGIKKFGEGVASAYRTGAPIGIVEPIGGRKNEVNEDIKNQQAADSSVQKVLYAARQEQDPVKKAHLLEFVKRDMNPSITPSQIDPGLDLSNKEVLGSAANVALNVATPGAFKGGNAVASKGAGLAARSLVATKNAAPLIAKNAALGGAFGLASGLEKDRSAGGVVGSGVGGAVIGAGIGGASLAVKVFKNFATKTTPEWLMNNAIKPSLEEARKTVKYGSDTLGKELLDEGVKGSPERLLKVANTKLDSLEKELEGVLNNSHISGAKIDRKNLSPFLSDVISHQKKVPGNEGNVERIKNIYDSIPEEMTLQQANEMKRAIYQELRSPAYKLDAKLSAKAATLKAVAKGLKTEIENQFGGDVVKQINRKLSLYGRLEDRIVDQLARSMRNNGFGLTDAILAAGGIASFNPLGLLASLTAVGARHAGTGIETGLAQGLNKLDAVGTGNVAKTGKELLRRGTLNVP